MSTDSPDSTLTCIGGGSAGAGAQAARQANAGRVDLRIGIFSTIPVEVLFAAGLVPIDVNNLFVAHPDVGALLRAADAAGLPRNLCAWTRGLFGACLVGDIRRVVVVPRGDCTNNNTMATLLTRLGIEVIPFNYPTTRDEEELRLELAAFRLRFQVSEEAVEQAFERLKPVRRLLDRIDRLNWEEGRLPGAEARRFLLQSTDMGGNPTLFARRLEAVLSALPPPIDSLPLAQGKPPAPPQEERGAGRGGSAEVVRGTLPRVAIFGVPAALQGLPEELERLGAFVALCETEHDFAMLPPAPSLVRQMLDYAYPYGIEARLARFLPLLAQRRIDGVVIYAQAFCHHNLELARVERELRDWPTLVVEGDVPGPLPGRDRSRLEAFVGLLSARAVRPCALLRTASPGPLGGGASLSMLAATGDDGCRKQDAKCKTQDGQAPWLSATIRLRTTLRRDFGDHPPSHEASAGLRRPSASAGRFGGTSSPITHDCRSARSCLATSADPPRPAPNALHLGLDLGSRFAKVAASQGGDLRKLAMDSMEFYRRFASRREGRLVVELDLLLEALGLAAGPAGPPVSVVATGYGRNLLAFENARTIPEIQAHALGAASQIAGGNFLLLDLGGQDSKAILVAGGQVEAFVMNDKCAAGSGRYVENMARLLGLATEEVMRHWEDPVALTNVCATFGESEIVGAVVDGIPAGRIAAGIMASVATRTAQLAEKLPRSHGLATWLAGGLAESAALQHFLNGLLEPASLAALPDPRFNGALGCLASLTSPPGSARPT